MVLGESFFRILAHEATSMYMRGDGGAKYMAPNVTALQVFTCTLMCIYVEIPVVKCFCCFRIMITSNLECTL